MTERWSEVINDKVNKLSAMMDSVTQLMVDGDSLTSAPVLQLTYQTINFNDVF